MPIYAKYLVDTSVREMDEIVSEEGRSAKDVHVKTGEIFPGDIAPVLALAGQGFSVHAMVFGFPRWDTGAILFDANAETVLEKRMFHKALIKSRVVIPTNGVFERTKQSGPNAQEKVLFTDGRKSMLYVAGFYNTFDKKDSLLPERFVMLTVKAEGEMKKFHDRFPLVLGEGERLPWLRGEQMETFLDREAAPLTARQIEGAAK